MNWSKWFSFLKSKSRLSFACFDLTNWQVHDYQQAENIFNAVTSKPRFMFLNSSIFLICLAITANNFKYKIPYCKWIDCWNSILKFSPEENKITVKKQQQIFVIKWGKIISLYNVWLEKVWDQKKCSGPILWFSKWFLISFASTWQFITRQMRSTLTMTKQAIEVYWQVYDNISTKFSHASY